MVRLKWVLGIIGLCLGSAYSITMMVVACYASNGWPGIPELMFMAVIIAVCALVAGGVGFGVGSVADWMRKGRAKSAEGEEA